MCLLVLSCVFVHLEIEVGRDTVLDLDHILFDWIVALYGLTAVDIGESF